MSSVLATLRASSTASMVQQPCIAPASSNVRDRCQICMVMPTTSNPACLRRAAVTELSTPPLIPTRTDPLDDITNPAPCWRGQGRGVLPPPSLRVYRRLAGPLQPSGLLGKVLGTGEKQNAEWDADDRD